jgi:hypothetical protein
VTRQAAMFLALGALAAASAVVSFGAWILLRRGTPPPREDGPDTEEEPDEPERSRGWIED